METVSKASHIPKSQRDALVIGASSEPAPTKPMFLPRMRHGTTRSFLALFGSAEDYFLLGRFPVVCKFELFPLGFHYSVTQKTIWRNVHTLLNSKVLLPGR